MDKNISAVILAGGENSRFGGKPKQELLIGNETILSRQLKLLRNGLFGEIIIVTNNPERYSAYTDLKVISDHFKGLGPLGGIHAALRSAKGAAVFVIAGDMPYPDEKIIRQLIKQFITRPSHVLLPVIDGLYEPLHAVYSTSLAGKLTQYLKSEKNPSAIGFCRQTGFAEYHPHDLMAARKAFTNINTPSDLDSLDLT